jgi:hypothetical protein
MHRTTTTLLIAGLFLIAVAARCSPARYTYYPLDMFIETSDFVEVGKIVSEDKRIGEGGREWAVYTIQVRETLKGKRRETTKISYTTPGQGAPLSYQVGQDGIWVLMEVSKTGALWANHPQYYYPLEKRAEIEAALKRIKTRRFGTPVRGLQTFIQVQKEKYAAGEPLLLFVGLRNASARPLTVCVHRGSVSIRARIINSSGKTTEVDLDRSTPKQPSGSPPLQKDQFVTFSPGVVLRRLGNFGEVALPRQPPGAYQVVFTYRNGQDGKTYGLKNVWTGAVTATTRVTIE